MWASFMKINIALINQHLYSRKFPVLLKMVRVDPHNMGLNMGKFQLFAQLAVGGTIRYCVFSRNIGILFLQHKKGAHYGAICSRKHNFFAY